jgi:hypothetical protein
MTDQRRAPLWRTLLSPSWRHYEMPHPQLTWVVLYLVFVLGLAGTSAVIGISDIWAFVAGGLIAVFLIAALEARYRRQHPLR